MRKQPADLIGREQKNIIPIDDSEHEDDKLQEQLEQEALDLSPGELNDKSTQQASAT